MNTTGTSPYNPRLTTRELTLIGLMTAVTCVLGPLSLPLPISPVPITFTNLAIFLSVYVLGSKKGLISCLVYYLLGLVGLPVFSGFSGGLGKAAGPTGGYLIGFFFMIPVIGYFIQNHGRNKRMAVLGMTAGTLICYLFGTLWLCRQLEISFLAGLGLGVIPYLPGDAAKIAIAAIVGPILRTSVNRL